MQSALSNCELHLCYFDTAYEHVYWATVTGSHSRLFLFTLHLSCVAVAKLKTCPLEFSSLTYELWQDWQAAAQEYSTTKHFYFYTMFSSVNTKEFLFTCQHDYSVQCFLLNADWRSYFPTWSCGKSWDVGQRSPTILPGLPHAFGPWSGQSVSLSPLLKYKQGVWVRKEGKGKASEKEGERSVEWIRT